jgi:cytochrome c oxidase subunit II
LEPSAAKPPRVARLRSLRLAAPLAALLTLAITAPARASIIAPESPHSPNASDITTTYWVMLVIGALFIVAFHVALIAATLRFRERRGRRPVRETARRGVVPRTFAAFAVLAAAVLVFGIVMTSQTRSVEESGPNGLQADAARYAQVGLQDVPETQGAEGATATPSQAMPAPTTGGGPLEIDAIAQQWLWRFEYPGNDPQTQPLFSYSELVVPVDTTVILDITSTDVMHSWWIPSLGGQVQAVPGTTSQTWFKADEEGVYEGPSTTFSGTSFPAMRAWVRVVGPEDYKSYLDDLKQELTKAGEIVQRQVEQGTGPAGVTP